MTSNGTSPPGAPGRDGSSKKGGRRFVWWTGGALFLMLIGFEMVWLRGWLQRHPREGATAEGQAASVRVDYARADSISIVFSHPVVERGIQLLSDSDGVTMPEVVEGSECHTLTERKTAYAYFAVEPSFKLTNWCDLVAEVEYFDAARGRFDLQYDAWSRHGDEGRYARTARRLVLNGSRQWKTNVLSMPDARLENRQNSGADLRARAEASGGAVSLRRITLRRVSPPREGPYTRSNEVSVTLASNLVSAGLTLGHDPDGVKFATNAAGQECYGVRPGPTGSGYLYVAVDPSFKAAHPGDCAIEVEYFSPRPCRFRVEYDGEDNGQSSEYKAAATVSGAGGNWDTATFFVRAPRFRNSQNDEADFRVNTFNNRLFIRRVTLRPANRS